MSAAPPPAPAADQPVAASVAGRPSRAWLLLVIAGLAGGGLSWCLLERYEHPFAAPEELEKLSAKRMAMIPMTDAENARIAELEADQERKNSAAAIAAIGLPLAALVGLAAGLLGRSGVASVTGLVGGAVAGAVLGAAGGWIAAFVYEQLKIELGVNRGYAAAGSHAATWAFVALAVALAAWPGVRKSGMSLAATAGSAVVGALIAAALYPVIAGLAFAMSNSDLIIPAGRWNRLAWIEVAAFAITAVIIYGLMRTRRPRASAAPSP